MVFLSFANNQEAPLPLLKKESEKIIETLTPGASRQFFQLHPDPFATIATITRYLIEFKDRVVIFHYGGHANSEALILTDQEADAQGVAQLLKGQKQLQLVFLNGCSTEAQVNTLLELGIPVVIATACPIEDDTAAEFAAHFYNALYKRHSIKEAFEMATGFVQSQKDKAQGYQGINSTRAAGWMTDEQTEADPIFSWGLFFNDATALDWKLPMESSLKKEIIIRQAADQFNFNKAPVNTHLVKVLLNALRPFSRDLDYYLSKLEEEEEVDERLLNRQIIDCLPAPIGEQIRKLFSLGVQSNELDKIGVPRLRQLMRTYITLVEFIIAAQLAELWHLKFKNAELEIPAEILETLKSFLLKENAGTYDYAALIQTLINFFAAQGCFQSPPEDFFLSEMGALLETFEQDAEFKTALDFMLEMQQEVEANAAPACRAYESAQCAGGDP